MIILLSNMFLEILSTNIWDTSGYIGLVLETSNRNWKLMRVQVPLPAQRGKEYGLSSIDKRIL